MPPGRRRKERHRLRLRWRSSARKWLPGPRSLEAADLVDVAAGHAERRVVTNDRVLVRALEQAVHLPGWVVVQLDLPHAEHVGLVVAGIVGDLLDCLRRQLQVLVEVHESWHLISPAQHSSGTYGWREASAPPASSAGGSLRRACWFRRA